ncbi:PREDICTED: ATP synthase subunit f, mitochondrial [Lipotes vexillifer]|uniref:ATP synthase F(0) complex subunit f, mitochondrial n=1 Tax=Lipotes vexillifer TaxID=118797 RepID=A0A340WJP4_LIPVE|nr:PREDICTED: ATP synthase subunit f, mitochondrial [Lipotes vexillifer]
MELEAGVHIYPRPPSKRSPHVETQGVPSVLAASTLFLTCVKKLQEAPRAHAPYPAVLARPRGADSQDFKMGSIVPLKDKKLLEVKLGELPSWILMRDFTPKGIAGAFQRGYYRYYNKYINVKKGSIAGLSMVLAAYVLFNYCRSYKELKHERLRKYH